MTDIIGEAWYKLRPDLSTFRLEAQAGVTAALSGIGLGAGANRAAGSLLRGAGPLAGITAIALGAKAAIGGAASLEQQLDVLQEVGQATDEQMQRVAQTARDLGADLTLPGISATDSAAAMLELIKGGVGVEDTLTGARGALQLATAANIDFAESAAIVARTLTTFDEPGSEAVRVADLLAAAANAATGEVGDMALALQQSGAVAHQAGLDVADTVTAIALLAKNGLLGSDAGTSLRTTLLRLIPQSKEAADVMKALGIEIADAGGNIRPLGDIFEQFKQRLQGLTQVQRQQALETIFGTDAIRAAAIFANEGAAGFDAMADATGRQGAAADTAAARTEGFSGALGNLGSQAETLATNIGSKVIPKLTDLTNAFAGLIGDVNNSGDEIDDFFAGLSDALGRNTPFGISADDLLPTPNEVTRKVQEILDPFVNTIKDVKPVPIPITFSAVDALTGGIQDQITRELGPTGALAEKLRIQASDTGHGTGKAFGDALADGVISAEQEAVNAAQATLREVLAAGKDAIAEAIRQGDEAVRLSAVSARGNLVSIGQSLAADALALLEEGPLARRIDQLRAQLDRARAGSQRTGLRDDLRDAERALREAQGQAETAGPLTPAQQAARQRFLEPFKRDVRDAKTALAEFNTEGVIAGLEKQAEAQREVVQQGIADLIVQFNTGAINVAQANTRLANLLATNGVEPYGLAGRRLGIAFRTKFELELQALREQAIEIARGIDVPEVGLEPTVVSPTGERQRQDQNVARTREEAAAQERAARDRLIRAQNALRRSNDELRTDGIGPLIAAINANTKSQGGKRPRASIPEGTVPQR